MHCISKDLQAASLVRQQFFAFTHQSSVKRYTALVPKFKNYCHFVVLEAEASEDTGEEIFPIFFFSRFFFWKGREESLYIEDLWGSFSRKEENLQKGA